MNLFEKHPQWPSVIEICETLQHKGYTAWLAGGCVRDLLMNVSPQDFDVATNATPEEVQKIFSKSIDVGKSFGIIMIPFQDYRVEIATFRSDGLYQDGRRPTSIVFTTPEEDAQRRDFTVNALFYDPFQKEVKDFVNGLADLKSKILRAVGDPVKRFEEDKLRMLRAVRFFAQLGFSIESETLAAIVRMAPEISKISSERIHYELKRMLQTPRASAGLQLLDDVGLLKVMAHDIYSAESFHKAIQALKKVEDWPVEEKFSLLWYFFREHPQLEAYLKKMKYPQKQIEFYFYIMSKLKEIETDVLSKGEQYELAFHPYAKIMFQIAYQLNICVEKIKKIEDLLSDFPSLPEPLLNGNDLKQLGVAPSAEMKVLLKKAYYYQLERRVTDKNELIFWTKAQIT